MEAPTGPEKNFDITEIINGEHITAYFQPLISVQKKAIIGFEGLARGIHPEDKSIISPIDLFTQANARGLNHDLDLLCREKVLESFLAVKKTHPEVVLTLNIGLSTIEKKTWSGYLKTQVMASGLTPQEIVIEIVESAVLDNDKLRRFVENYREAGFLIALDDVGSGQSSLNRIPQIKPDIIKVDRYLVTDIEKDFYKQEVLKSLVSMSEHLGTVIIAEGVETYNEADTLLELGVDVMQGYYFGKPIPREELEDGKIRYRIEELGHGFKKEQIIKIGNKRFVMKRYFTLLENVQRDLVNTEMSTLEEKLSKVAKSFADIESLYVLNEDGLQATDMVINTTRKAGRNSLMFKPFPKGADHSTRDYYYFLMDSAFSKSTYVTRPYISLATGNSCVTIGSLFLDQNQKKYILCLDIKTPNN
jgi:EAL domain-containing protein (putative c-di-GMP-specific phosphodiesterase class I)